MNWGVAMLPTYGDATRHSSYVGGASLWVLKGHSDAEYKAAAAFFNFIAKPEEALTWSTVTGYIPVRNSGFEYLKKQGFYDKAPYLRPRTRHSEPDRFPGWRRGSARHPSRWPAAGPHRNRQWSAGNLRQQCRCPGFARRRCRTRQYAAASLPADLQERSAPLIA